jgi:hypothetical protein
LLSLRRRPHATQDSPVISANTAPAWRLSRPGSAHVSRTGGTRWSTCRRRCSTSPDGVRDSPNIESLEPGLASDLAAHSPTTT